MSAPSEDGLQSSPAKTVEGQDQQEEEAAASLRSETPLPQSPQQERKNSGTMAPSLTLDNPTIDWRNMRRIIAEDPEWSLAIVPPLSELNLRLIVENFAHNSKVLNDLLPTHQKNVLGRISTSLPLKVTCQLIDDEGYWERCCKARWEICDPSAYGGWWKRMYCERNLQNIIELFVPGTTDFTELSETLQITSKFIRKLDVRQLLPPVKEAPKETDCDDSSDAESDNGDKPVSDHFDFAPVLSALPDLEEFHVMYGVRDCGMNFEWNMFKFTERDCLQLAKAVAEHKTLRMFHLHRSKVDDEKVRVFISHIINHDSLEVLDLSNNIIGDQGARAVGKFIKNNCQLVRLNLTDNHIRAQGAQAIAHALIKNNVLKHLNLRHNHLSDEGAQAIFRALLKNTTLIDINLSSNDITEPSASMLSEMVTNNSTLKSLDLSCNRLGPDCGKLLQDSMEVNRVITQMDLRLTECGHRAEYSINLNLHRNREADRDTAIKRLEANAPPQRKTADPQAAHRYKIPCDFLI